MNIGAWGHMSTAHRGRGARPRANIKPCSFHAKRRRCVRWNYTGCRRWVSPRPLWVWCFLETIEATKTSEKTRWPPFGGTSCWTQAIMVMVGDNIVRKYLTELTDCVVVIRSTYVEKMRPGPQRANSRANKPTRWHHSLLYQRS
jgi:hypothetical protein